MNRLRDLNLLVVEDDAGDVALLKAVLASSEGPAFNATFAHNFGEGVSAVRSGASDLLLLDLNLPDSPADETLAALPDLAFRMPVVVLTGLEDESFAASALRAGAQDFVSKSEITQVRFRRILTAAVERFRLQFQLRQSQKMEAVGRLAGGMAHDFNNILSAILSYGELLRLRVQDDPEALEELEIMEQAGRRAAELVQQLLAFSRGQVLEARSVDLAELLENMAAMLRRLIGADVKIALEISAELDRAWADPTQLQQVVLNLVLNARDAMPSGGRLWVRARNAAAIPATPAQAERAGRFIALEFEDEGCGMDPATLARIFEPFFTTKGAAQQRNGLGLAIVDGIIAQSGGALRVRSEPGKGSTFEVYLPGADPAPSRSDVPRIPADCGGKVLLVDDNSELRTVTALHLRRLGYDVLEAASTFEALERASQEPGFDLLLTDVELEDRPGTELAAELLKSRPELPVVFMSGYGADVLGHAAPVGKRIHFLAKPFPSEALRQKLSEAIEGL
jgi:signal transduction histidine kinase